ncbi:polysaccharide pyruvyl transferase family protein [Microbacterium sp. LMI12-1-1.1]
MWTRDADAHFLSGMGLTENDRVERSYSRWYWAAAGAALRGKATIALNAGEVPVSRSGALRLASLTLLGGLARIRGGRLLWLGVGIPPTESLLSAPYKSAARIATHVWARDPDTQRLLVGSELVPDWAFSLGTPTDEWDASNRQLLVVSLRGDRNLPADDWLDWIRKQASDHELEIVTVSQVARDNERTAELATRLSGKLILFEGRDHAEHESVVRDVYGRSKFVVSDRLHGLIVAASEGAIPIGWVPTSKGKVRRHFDGAGMPWVGKYEGIPAPELPELVSAPTQEYLASSIGAARDRIASQAASLTLVR